MVSIHSTVSQRLFTVTNLHVNYNTTNALEHITFDLYQGEKLAIIGPNGAGKSTLLKTLMGFTQPMSGHTGIDDANRQRLGYVPQHNQVNWDFPITVGDVVMMGLTRDIGWLRMPRRKHWQRVGSALERVGMDDLAQRPINDLSGGQQRRVFIARTLVQRADILLLDEPFAGVDVRAQSELMDVLDALNANGLTIIFTTHDLNLAFQRFDRVMALNQRIIAIGKPTEVYRQDVLEQLYGGRFMSMEDGKSISLIVDDAHCEHDC